MLPIPGKGYVFLSYRKKPKSHYGIYLFFSSPSRNSDCIYDQVSNCIDSIQSSYFIHWTFLQIMPHQHWWFRHSRNTKRTAAFGRSKRKGFKPTGYILCQNNESSRFYYVTSFKLVLQLLQAIIPINLAYILTGLNVSPEIQNRQNWETEPEIELCIMSAELLCGVHNTIYILLAFSNKVFSITLIAQKQVREAAFCSIHIPALKEKSLDQELPLVPYPSWKLLGEYNTHSNHIALWCWDFSKDSSTGNPEFKDATISRVDFSECFLKGR